MARQHAHPGTAASPDGSWTSVREEILGTARAWADDPTLAYDADGDVPLWLGDQVGFVRVVRDPLMLRLWAVLSKSVKGDERTLRAVHEAGARLPLVRLVLTGSALFAAVELPAAPFVPEHLLQAREALREAVAGVGRRLAREVSVTA